jgi:hypothetical protein
MEGHYEETQVETTTMTELEMCKTALCFKEHELFTLRADVQTQQAIVQTLSKSVERLEKTLAARMDQLLRAISRQREESPPPANSKRRRHNNY